MDTIAKKIKYYREKENLSKSEFARRLNVSAAYITMLENGKKENPSINLLINISQILKINYLELIKDTEYDRLKGKEVRDIPLNLFSGPGKYVGEKQHDPVKELQNVSEECLDDEREMILELVKHYNIIYCDNRYDLSKMNEEHFRDLKVMFYTTIKTVLKDCIK